MQLGRIDSSLVKRVAQNIPRTGLSGIQVSLPTLRSLVGSGMVQASGSGQRSTPSMGSIGAQQIQGAFQKGGEAGLTPAPGATGGDFANNASLLYDIERSMLLTPWTVLPQHFKVYPLPGTVANGVLTFTPQRNVIPFAMSMREAEATGTLSALQVGITPLFASGAAVPAGMFGPMSPDTRWLPPVVAEVGQTITANVTGITRAALWCADVDAASPMSEPLRSRLMPIGFSSAAIAATSQGTVTITPQVDFRLRRLAFVNPSASGDFAACPDVTVTSILVGNQPQTEGTGEIPLDTFLDTYIAGFLDADYCRVGLTITVGLFNHTAGALTLIGACHGDTR